MGDTRTSTAVVYCDPMVHGAIARKASQSYGAASPQGEDSPGDESGTAQATVMTLEPTLEELQASQLPYIPTEQRFTLDKKLFQAMTF